MNQVILPNPTGNRDVDRALRATIGIFETTFPATPKSFYLYGSQADGSAVPSSDIDLLIVFGDGFRDDDEQRAEELCRYCQQLTELRFEPSVRSQEQLVGDPLRVVIVKQGSHLLYGADIRERLPLPPVEVYARQVTRNLRRFLLGALRKTATATFPLAYPDPNGEFYGYAQDEILAWHPDCLHGGGTQELVVSTGWAATTLLALRAGRVASSRSEAFRLYEECFGDEWAGFLREVYHTCKLQWGYQVPASSGDRAHPRELCRRTLAFENHVLSVYRGYLLEELRAEDTQRRRFAAERLAEFIYADEEVRAALVRAEQADDPEVPSLSRHTSRRALSLPVLIGSGARQ